MTTTLRRAFDDALAGEPPLADGPARAAAQGRRLRRRRQVGRAGALAVAAAVLATVAVPVLRGDAPRRDDQLTIRPFTALGDAPAEAPREAAPHAANGRLTAQQRRIAEAIRSSSPRGWTFEMDADRWSTPPGAAGSSLEATADDGAGPGRLMVAMSPSPGSQLLHPCRDAEFAAGASCEEVLRKDGSVLSLRGPVSHRGFETIFVVLSRPDGSGVGIESGNFTIPWPLPRIAPPHVKRDLPQITRPDPTYTLEQLTRVVDAVDRAVRE